MLLMSRPISVFHVPGVLLLTLCTAFLLYFLPAKKSYQPIHRLEVQEILLFSDDLERESLIEAARHQVAYLEKQDARQQVRFGQDSYDNGWLLFSLKELLTELQRNPGRKALNSFLQENYLVYQAGGRPQDGGRHMLVTGYYQPVFAGSLAGKPPYLTPIYSVPESLVSLVRPDGTTSIGRYDANNELVSFWSRAEIENDHLLQGDELAYLKDPFDAFLLHVQGSGKIRLPDGTLRSVHYAGSNGLEYKSIGKLLVDENIMSLEEVTVPAIRAYLGAHPDRQQAILQHNPRFIFFRWGDSLAPFGNSGERLTPGRSIAMDHKALPGGTIAYLVSRRPVMDADGNISGWTVLNRLVFPQDSGAAIKGTGRVDLFWGSGDYAELAASHMKEEGKLYFLVKKGYHKNQQVHETNVNHTARH